MTYNLHTHSFYCGHGSGMIKEYADRAEEKDFDILGFSEHIPFRDGFLSKSRMPYGDYASYESDVRKEKERRPFPVLLGYEVDVSCSSWLRGGLFCLKARLLRGSEREGGLSYRGNSLYLPQ